MADFTVLIIEGAYATGVAMTLDILFAAQTLAPRAATAVPTWRVCSMNGGDVTLQSGMKLVTTKLPAKPRHDDSTWIIPGLGLNSAASVQRGMESDEAVRAAAAISKHVQAGGSVAAACSAVFLLQAAGVLKGRRATTTWWLAPLLQRMEPTCVVDADRMVCSDGPRGGAHVNTHAHKRDHIGAPNIITAGAAFAQSDLMLHLLRVQFGNALVEAVSRMLLIDGREAQSPFIIPEVLASGSDLVARLAARIEAALPNPPSVTALAQEFCMSTRTLSRHVQSATGMSTQALINSVKLQRARKLLQSSRMTVDRVAEAVGYQDATALRRLMKKVAGMNPGRYRMGA
jgi:transcriptional regulator GlxA family with amidase domain